MDSKLKCVFEMPVDPATTGPQENNVDVSPAVHEEKAKRIGDGVKASPKVLSSCATVTAWLLTFAELHSQGVLLLQPNSTVEGELLKAAAEVKHLREEESSLRQENLQLKVLILC